MPGGRPPKYKTADELQVKCDEYFADCDSREKPYTVPGLAYFLGFISRAAIYELSKVKKFADTITRARLRIELQRNEQMLEAKNSRGHQFDLQNNFGWRDSQKIEHSGSVSITVIDRFELKSDDPA